jgi:hypothetical protein
MSLLGKTHVMRVYMNLATSPEVTDTVGVMVSVQFTSDLCQNAYIITSPILYFKYDISTGSK